MTREERDALVASGWNRNWTKLRMREPWPVRSPTSTERVSGMCYQTCSTKPVKPTHS